ncbi:hypothetical protein BOQ64_09955 [Chryseobacterium sp. CH25]|nr:hypothetical protein BOQ64_09955 [Chryseobacterium sp. CH25]RXM64070.1 hypothetical protein BOQ60_14325 [Chryseobacterium sp. CH1]
MVLFIISVSINFIENNKFSENDFPLLTLIYPISSLILFAIHYLIIKFSFVKDYKSYILTFSLASFLILAIYGYTLAAVFD